MKILIVIDVQEDFTAGSLGSKEAQAAIPAIVSRIDDADYDCLIATRDTHGRDYLSTREGRCLPVEHCIVGTPGHGIQADVAAAISKVHAGSGVPVSIIDKPTFGSTALVDAVRDLVSGQETENEPVIEIIGFCTDICVISNALLLKAHFYESARICVNGHCCAGVTPELHREALDVMRSCQIEVI